MKRSLVRLATAAFVALAILPAHAQGDVAAFYKGKTVQLRVGSAAGGGYDLIARTIARHMGRHIPGQPAIAVQNVTGGGGLKLLNDLYTIAPKDGSVIGAGISGTPTGALLTPGVTRFDPRNFAWLGSAGTETFLVVIIDKAPVQKLADLFKRELVVGASASGSASVDFPTVTNAILGTKFKIVSGYKAASVVVKIAMPAGEVDGISVYTLSGLRTQHAREYKEGKFRILLQWGLQKNADIPHVPLMPLGKTKEDYQLFELLYARGNYGRPYMLPPGVPPARVAALRKAFEAVFKDAAFVAEAKKQRLEVAYISAAEIAALTERVMATPKPVVARIQKLLPGGGTR
ncbi:MAG: Bug family tripartite tricarboxylate transporter substrate binding protein [Xanthobacteraceae bacterium]